jgi:hypothetical protein
VFRPTLLVETFHVYIVQYMMRQLEGDHSKEGRAKLEEGSKALSRLKLNHLILDEYERMQYHLETSFPPQVSIQEPLLQASSTQMT